MNWIYAKLRRVRWIRITCLRIVMPWGRPPEVRDVEYHENSREWMFLIAVPTEALQDGTVYYFDPQTAMTLRQLGMLP